MLDEIVHPLHLWAVPVISIFFGIVIRMYHDDHPPPHFHASYQGFAALVRIADGEILQGSLPKKAGRIVRQGRWTIGRRSWQTGRAAKRWSRWS